MFRENASDSRTRYVCLQRLSRGVQRAKISQRSVTADQTGKRGVGWNQNSRPESNGHGQGRADSAARQKTRGANRIGAVCTAESHEIVPFVALLSQILCCSRLEHRQNRRALEIARCDPLEMRADAAQFSSHKRVDKAQPAAAPGEQRVLYFLMNGKRHLGAVCPDLTEINDSH